MHVHAVDLVRKCLTFDFYCRGWSLYVRKDRLFFNLQSISKIPWPIALRFIDVMSQYDRRLRFCYESKFEKPQATRLDIIIICFEAVYQLTQMSTNLSMLSQYQTRTYAAYTDPGRVLRHVHDYFVMNGLFYTETKWEKKKSEDEQDGGENVKLLCGRS